LGNPPSTLDDLAALDAASLGDLYRAARTPGIAEIDGDLDGRMLAVIPAGPLRALLRSFAASGKFPWRGKSFKPLGDRGEGINRVFSDGAKGKRWFRFETYIAPSRAGAFDAFQLDYDNPGNPFFIRAIKDEIREVAPGLYLGQAYVMIAGKPRLALYFGLRKP
jgi:hypothetical protein